MLALLTCAFALGPSLLPVRAAEQTGAPTLGMRTSDGHVYLDWTSTSNDVYQIQRSRALSTPDWQPWAGHWLGNGHALAAADFADRRTTYYRLVVAEIPVVDAAEHGVRDETTLSNLLSAIGDQWAVLRLPHGEWVIGETITIPSNVTVCLDGGCMITGDGILRFNGGYLMDKTDGCFATNMVVSGLRQTVRPEWWGWSQHADAAVNREALSRSVFAADRAVVKLPAGQYPLGALGLAVTNIVIEGQSPAAYGLATGTPLGGTCLLGSVSFSGHHYEVRKLSVVFASDSSDPLLNVRGGDYRVCDVSVFGNTNRRENAHNVFVGGTNGVTERIASYNCWGHGFVSKSVGLLAVDIRSHNCRYGVTLKSGADGEACVVSNVLRRVSVTADRGTNSCGLVVMATLGQDMKDVTVTDFRADDLYMGVDIEASGGSVMSDVAIESASVTGCTYGFRSYMSSPATMTKVCIRGAQAVACAVGYFQQAPGTWIDVTDASAVDCQLPVTGRFRTADIKVSP